MAVAMKTNKTKKKKIVIGDDDDGAEEKKIQRDLRELLCTPKSNSRRTRYQATGFHHFGKLENIFFFSKKKSLKNGCRLEVSTSETIA